MIENKRRRSRIEWFAIGVVVVLWLAVMLALVRWDRSRVPTKPFEVLPAETSS
jgi:hypothetical protein